MKELGALSDPGNCSIVYELHTNSPILQQKEERLGEILDANYSQMDIDMMVNDLDIAKASKDKPKQTLTKFPTSFWGDLGTLIMEPADIEPQKGTKSYTSRFYNIPKAYKKMAKTKVNHLCTVDILLKHSYTENSPWAAPSFC